MRIERVEPSKHKKNRILVFLEGGQLLKITENELLHHDLRPGADLSEETVEELQKSAQASQMKARGAQLTGSRMLSKKQVVEHLTRRGGDREAAEDTALWLEELGAVDEAAYGAAIVRHYSASGYGPGRIRQELNHRGIPRDLWDTLFEQMPPAEETIERFIQNKRKGKQLNREMLQKLSGALQRRGFSWQDIQAPLRRLESEIQE